MWDCVLSLCIVCVAVSSQSTPNLTVLNYDVVVYDATSGGVMAAVSSARKKLNTLLICSSWPSCFEEGGHLIGGMSSGGLGQTDIGDTYPYIGGLAREFYERNSQFYKSRKHQYLFKHSGNGADCRLPSSNCSVTYNLEPHVAEHIFNEMIKEAGVKVLYGAQVARAKFSEVESTKVSRIGKRIKSITTTSGHEIFAKIFLDASYEGDLMAAANVSHVTGREGKDDYNESLAGLSAGSKKNQFDLKINPFDDNGRPLPFITKQMPFIEFNGKKRKIGSGDDIIQSYNFRLCLTRNVSNRIPFPKPQKYDPRDWKLLKRYVDACVVIGNSSNSEKSKCQIGFPSCNMGLLPNGKFDMNNCGGFSSDFIGGSQQYPTSDYEIRKQIWFDHLNYQQGFLYFLSNDDSIPLEIRNKMKEWGLCADEFKRNQISMNWPPALYVRGARRMLGDQVFTQNTPSEQKAFGSIGNSSIGVGGYNFDSHNGQRFACKNLSSCYMTGPPSVMEQLHPYNSAARSDTSFAWDEGDVEVKPDLYQIPYWVLTPKISEVTNLLNIATPSSSHIGMSTLRMEPQFMVLGHAAGTASYIAIESGTNVPVQSIDMNLLNKLLLKEKMILSTR